MNMNVIQSLSFRWFAQIVVCKTKCEPVSNCCGSVRRKMDKIQIVGNENNDTPGILLVILLIEYQRNNSAASKDSPRCRLRCVHSNDDNGALKTFRRNKLLHRMRFFFVFSTVWLHILRRTRLWSEIYLSFRKGWMKKQRPNQRLGNMWACVFIYLFSLHLFRLRHDVLIYQASAEKQSMQSTRVRQQKKFDMLSTKENVNDGAQNELNYSRRSVIQRSRCQWNRT